MLKHTFLIVSLLASVFGFSQAESIIEYGWELFSEKEYDLALQQFELADDVEKGNIQARIGRGRCYVALGKFNEAIDELRDIHEWGRYPQAEYDVGLALFKRKQYRESLFHFATSLEMDTIAKVYYYVGANKFELGENDQAQLYLTEYLKQDSANAYAWYYLSQVEVTNDTSALALQHAERALSINGNIPRFWRAKGDALLVGEDTHGAVVAYTEALTRNPDYAEARVRRAMVHRENGRLNLAVSDYERAQKRLKDDEDVLDGLIECYYLLGRRKEFFEASGQLLMINPERVDVLFKRGLVYLEMESPDLALDEFSVVHELYPEKSDVNFQLGNCYFMMEDYPSALYHYSLAAQADDPHHRAQFNMAVAFYESGKKTKACDLWTLQADKADHEMNAAAKENLEKYCNKE